MEKVDKYKHLKIIFNSYKKFKHCCFYSFLQCVFLQSPATTKKRQQILTRNTRNTHIIIFKTHTHFFILQEIHGLLIEGKKGTKTLEKVHKNDKIFLWISFLIFYLLHTVSLSLFVRSVLQMPFNEFIFADITIFDRFFPPTHCSYHKKKQLVWFCVISCVAKRILYYYF